MARLGASIISTARCQLTPFQPILVSITLIVASIVNAFYLFTRTKLYHLSLATEPIGSPHAKFVKREPTPLATEKPSSSPVVIVLVILKHVWRAFMVSIRFLLNMSPPKDRQTSASRGERVQQLEVWTPADLELALFPIYSPVHALLWMALTSANWMIMACIMFLTGVQVCLSILITPRVRC